jgi:hypothetical protein
LKPAPPASSGQSFISRLFGLRALPPVQPSTPQPGEIVTPLDIVRQQATEGYEAIKKYIDEHGQEILDDDKKRDQQMMEEQKVSLTSFFSRFVGQSPPAGSQNDKSEGRN